MAHFSWNTLYMSRNVLPKYGTSLVKHPVYVKERSPKVWHVLRETPCICQGTFSRIMAHSSWNTLYMSRNVLPKYGTSLVKHPVYVKERSPEVWHIPRETPVYVKERSPEVWHIPRETPCICQGTFSRSMAHPSWNTLYMSQQHSYSLLSHWPGLWSWRCAALFLLLHSLLSEIRFCLLWCDAVSLGERLPTFRTI